MTAISVAVLCVLSFSGLSMCAKTSDDPVRIVGSSTIFPFAAKVAEVYSQKTAISVVVEQTGSGGGHKLLCSGNPSIDATTSSRPQKPEEALQCEQNGVSVIEVRLGHDGIVLARSIEAAAVALDPSTIYHALARELPTSGTDCTPIPNPFTRWVEIDPTLPDIDIQVYGPPPTSGTRDAFVEAAMEEGARLFPCLSDLESEAPNLFRSRAHSIREDGHWVDAGENDNALIRTLSNQPTAFGVFGFSFLNQNSDKVTGVAIGGVKPTMETIRNGSYPVTRDLFLYLKDQKDADPLGFALEFTSADASGANGYLQEIGLVPLSEEIRTQVQIGLQDKVQDL
ncbi:MAG: substrate-binding domain-containing protein [Pseudomonadota bacterium]